MIECCLNIEISGVHDRHFQPENTAEQRAINANNLVRIVNEGHVLADHSYDHMYHNDQVLIQ